MIPHCRRVELVTRRLMCGERSVIMVMTTTLIEQRRRVIINNVRRVCVSRARQIVFYFGGRRRIFRYSRFRALLCADTNSFGRRIKCVNHVAFENKRFPGSYAPVSDYIKTFERHRVKQKGSGV